MGQAIVWELSDESTDEQNGDGLIRDCYRRRDRVDTLKKTVRGHLATIIAGRR